jgi:diaminohydroxyphosphoribosylaminopyrimidine deaminase/5-amino-6-(5-phosphoribosylamino)uracil reductase
VGCLVVHNGIIIGEGWHKKYGEAHAEVNAIENVQDKSLLKESIVYVNLEPCSHTGKTPPCADLLIKHQVKKVVVSNLDSNPLVSGNGVKKLRSAGIEVVTGILEQEGRELNKRFFAFMEKQRPYILLKWAETSDGFIAKENHDSKWISNEYSRQLVHKFRSEEDAVLVGSKTAIYDNPELNVRDWSGRNPVRVVLDRFLRLNESLHLFDRSQKTLCYNVLKHEEHANLTLALVEERNFIQSVLDDLYKRKIQSVMVEGGATVLQLFIDAGLWDEAKVFVSEKSFGKGIKAPHLNGNLIARESVFNDTVRTYHPLHGKNQHS